MKERFFQSVRTERGYVSESGFVFQLYPHSGEGGPQLGYRVLYPCYNTRVYLSQELFEQQVTWEGVEAFGEQDLVKLSRRTGYVEVGDYEIRAFRSTPNWVKVRNGIGLEVDIELEERNQDSFYQAFYYGNRHFSRMFWASSNPHKFVVLPRRPSTFLPESEVPYKDPFLQENLNRQHVNEHYADGISWNEGAFLVDSIDVTNVHGTHISYQYRTDGSESLVHHPTEDIWVSPCFKDPWDAIDFADLYDFDSIGNYESFYQLFLLYGDISVNGVSFSLSHGQGHAQVQAVYCGEEDGWFTGTKHVRFPYSRLSSLPDMIGFTQRLREQR